MRVVLLTTETTPHVYYACRLAEAQSLSGIVVQMRPVEPPFDVAHPYERLRDAFERDQLLAGGAVAFADLAEVVRTQSVNDAVPRMLELRPDVVIVLGTGRLRPPAIAAASTACLSLCAGDPERYRGLDSHLWAIYHRDFGALVTTLHHVDPALDTGDIVAQTPVAVTRGMELHELRAADTRASVELSLATLAAIDRGDQPSRRRPQAIGRYYSFMPSVLKELCVESFRRYTAWL